MPYSPDQLETDVGYLTSLPQWQDEAQRPQFIRDVASKARTDADPDTHRQLVGELWNRAKGGVSAQGADFVQRSAGEVLKSIPAAPAAGLLAASDAVGTTDSGSGTRLMRGAADMADAVVQRVKQNPVSTLFPMAGVSGRVLDAALPDRQAARDNTLDSLRQDLDAGIHPAGLERWLSGDDEPDAETKPWVDALTRGIATRAVAADHAGKMDEEKVNAWLKSDRNPAFLDSDTPGVPGPRALLADYLVTRDPSSWDAFKARVSETDSQYTTRLQRFASEAPEFTPTVGAAPKDSLAQEMLTRTADMQTSPLDLASAVLPVLRSVKILKAAHAGVKGQTLLRRGAEDAAKEFGQEAVTEMVSDPNASTAQILEAGAMGGIGQGVVSAPAAIAGRLLRPATSIEPPASSNDNLPPSQTATPPGTPQAPGAPTAAPQMGGAAAAPVSPLIGIAQRAGAVDVDPLLPESTGDLTAEDVADLEPEVSSSRFQVPRPILQGMPDRAAPFRDNPFAAAQEETGNLITDLRIPRSPQAIAQSQQQEQDRLAQQAKLRNTEAKTGRGPVLPESTGDLTAEDVQDLETQNLPLSSSSETLPTVANPDPAQTITGSNVQTGTEMPVPPPTADAGAGAGAPGVVNQSQSSYLDRVLDAAIQDESMGELTIPVPEKNQNRDDLDKAVAVIEARGLNAASDGKSILVRGFRELRRAAPPPSNPVSPSPSPQVPARNASRSDAGRSPSESSSPTGLTNTALKRDLQSGFMTTAGADALLDLAHRAFAAGQTFVQWSKTMLQRFGDSIRQWLAGAWDHAKRSSQTGAVNFTGRLGSDLQRAAQQAKGGASGTAQAGLYEAVQQGDLTRAAQIAAAMGFNVGPVFHGTTSGNRLETLRTEHHAIHSPELNTRLGAMFAVNRSASERFATGDIAKARGSKNGRVIASFLNIKNPLEFETTTAPGSTLEKAIKAAGFLSKAWSKTNRDRIQQRVWKTYGRDTSIEARPDLAANQAFELRLLTEEEMANAFKSQAIAAGYDGIYVKQDFSLGPVWIAFREDQIKLVDLKADAESLAESGAAGIKPKLGERGGVTVRDSQQPEGAGSIPAPTPGAVNSESLRTAYIAAMQGRSSAMVPIADVYQQALTLDPTLTVDRFMAEVQAGDNAGTVLLEPFDTPQGLQAAGPFVVRNGSGIPSTSMMVQRGFTHLDVSGQASQAGFVLNPLPALERLAARLLPLHQRGEPFRVKQLGTRAILTGSPLPPELVRVLDMTENERQAVAQAGAQVGNDLQAAVKAYLDRTGQDELATWDKVNAVMEGRPGALLLLGMIDPALGERARRARNLLDDLSAAVAQTLPVGDLRTAIVQNQGAWMRRGYAAFDPESGWNFDGLTKAAAAGRLMAGKDAAQILANARAYLRAQNPQQGRTLKEWNADIEADMRDLMDREQWQAANLGGQTVRKNVSSFMKRKTIAPEIRALMGEETNPLHRFAKSAAFQAQIIARHHGQLAMRALGLQTGLFSTQRGGVYTEEINADGNRWSGLAGVWTTPELKAALANTSTVNREGSDLGGWVVGALKALGNEAKLNRVALNPDSWVVNILGNVVGLVQSGDVFAFDFVRRLKDARALIRSGKARPGAVQTAAQTALVDAQRAMLARLRGMGVIGSSITLNDIEASIPKHLLQWVAEDRARNAGLGAVKGAIVGQAIGRGLGMPGRIIGGVAGGIGGGFAGAQRLQNWQKAVADYVMTGPDALARVTGWLTNYETALASGMTTDQAAAWASERTLNTFPNYAKLPALLRQASRLGFTGSFIAFQWEVYRNFGWNVKYAVDELRSGNAAIQARGLRRLAGIGSVAALAGGGLAALLGMAGASTGDDDERNQLWRQWFAAPWEKDAVLAFDKFDMEGVSYYNTSYLLPQVTMMELMQAATEGADPADSASRVVARLSEQFLNGSVHLQPLLAAFTNQDRFGRKITNAEGLEGAAKRADAAAQTILEPGFADKVTRIIYALRGAEKNGRSYSVTEEMKRLAGIRQVSRTWEELVKRRYSKFTYDYQAVRDDANKMLGENLPGAPIKAVQMVNDKAAQLEAQLTDYERALRRLGVPEPTIKRAKKDSNLQRLNPVKVRADGRRVEATTKR